MTAGDLVVQMAAAAGIRVDADDVEHIIWSETGFPCFWPDRSVTPEENFRRQLREYFTRLRPVKKGRGQRRNRRNR